MTNPVIEETGDLSLSTPVALVHEGGDLTNTRATIADHPQSEGQLEGIFSDNALNAWCPTPSNTARVEHIQITREGVTSRWRVNDSERTSGPRYGSVAHSTTRYELIQPIEIVGAVTNVDFDPVDYDPADFN